VTSARAAPSHPRSLDRTLAALADPHRRRVVDLLRERPHRAGELAAVLELTPPVMSRHLRVLRESGLVDDAHPAFDARVRIYSLRSGPMDELRSWLAATQRGWVGELTAFKDHVEQQR